MPRAGECTITVDTLRVLLGLPADAKIIKVYQRSTDMISGAIRLVIEHPGLPNVYPGSLELIQFNLDVFLEEKRIE